MEKRFDPMTGQPIQPQAAPQETQMRFDPMTGQPIQPAPAPQPQMRFDPMTGQPIQPQYQAPYQAPKKKSKVGIIIGAVVVALVFIAIIIFALLKSGIFLSANDKIILATTNTFEERTALLEDLDVEDIVKSGKYTIDLDASYEGNTIDCSYIVNKNEQQLKGIVSASGIPNIDFDIVLADGKVQAYTSLINNYLFQYDYENVNSGYLVQQIPSESLQMLNDSLKELANAGNIDNSEASDAARALLKDYRDLKFEKVDAKDVVIDEKSRSCKGYMTCIDKATMRKFVDDMKIVADENKYTVENYEEIYEEIDNMPNLYVTVYIYKNKLACISLKTDANDNEMQILFHGGKTRWQNMEILENGSSIGQLVGKIDGSMETYDVIADGMTVASLSYDKSSGTLSMNSGEQYILCRINRTKKDFTFTLEYIDGLSGSLSITKGADIVKPTAEKTFDVGNATESELQALMIEIMGSGSALGDLLYGSY